MSGSGTADFTDFSNFTRFQDLGYDDRMHCATTMVCCLISLLMTVPVVYVYYFHRQYTQQLRSHFNNLIVGSVLVQSAQSVQRVITAAVLLSGTMEETGCQVASAIDSSLDTTSVVLILGFYYSLMSLRFNPLRSCVLLCVSSQTTFTKVRRIAWFVVAACVGIATAVAAVRVGKTYGYFFGWCSALGSPWFFFSTLFFPLWLLILVSIATMISLRCCVRKDGGSAGIAQPLTWSRHWSIYVRFFTIIFYVAATVASTVITHFILNRSQKHDEKMLLPSILQCLWPGMVSFTFLLTEGILHNWTSSFTHLCCGKSPHDYAGGSPQQLSLARLEAHDTVTSEYGDTCALGGGVSTRQSLQLPRDATTINGFTTAIQSLLVMEVQGVHYIVTNQTLMDEHDQLLSGNAASSPQRQSYASPVDHNSVSETPSERGGGAQDHGLYGASGTPIIRHLGASKTSAQRYQSELSDRQDVV